MSITEYRRRPETAVCYLLDLRPSTNKCRQLNRTPVPDLSVLTGVPVMLLSSSRCLFRVDGQYQHQYIQGILLVSRGKENEFIPSNINKIVKEYVWLSYHAMRANYKGFNVSIHEQYQENMPLILVIPQDLSRAILNLMNNAFYAVWSKSQTAGEGYQPEISVNVNTDSSQLTIIISDNGVGMSDEVKQKLYENFFTTKPIGQGTGLGMNIIRDIIENKHGGRITFESVEGEGTQFTLTIPVKK